MTYDALLFDDAKAEANLHATRGAAVQMVWWWSKRYRFVVMGYVVDTSRGAR